MTSPVALTLYSRNGCTLCEDLVWQLQEVAAELPTFDLSIIDIAGNPELERSYGRDIPVLFCGDREVCRHFLDLSALRRECHTQV